MKYIFNRRLNVDSYIVKLYLCVLSFLLCINQNLWAAAEAKIYMQEDLIHLGFLYKSSDCEGCDYIFADYKKVFGGKECDDSWVKDALLYVGYKSVKEMEGELPP